MTLNTILTRKSVREYTDKKIDPNLITIILKAAMSAPSAVNTQPWQFIVITEKEILEEIPNFSEYATMCRLAPLAILVCGDLEIAYGEYWIQDCSAAMQNLLLACHEIGLGAVWTGAYPNKKKIEGFKNLLHLPKQIIPLGLAVIGYPKKKEIEKDNFKKEKIHYNHW